MTDEQLERALDVTCPQCGEPSGWECIGPHGIPLLETAGIPVHGMRGME